MATISFDTYHSDDPGAISRTNIYIVDGHGTPAERTNRYILSHAQETPHAAHYCPDDPKLATSYMYTLQQNYERKHQTAYVTRTEDCGKKGVTHIQVYFSWAEHEDVPAWEALEMTAELIEATFLKDFASFYAYHDNTWIPEMQPEEGSPEDKKMEPTEADGSGNIHVHLSVSPFSLDGGRKLLMNNKTRYELWKAANRICVEHGYSIVNHPALLADPEYRKWFEQVAAEGNVKIHPYKGKGKKDIDRKEKVAAARRRARLLTKARRQEIADMIAAEDPQVTTTYRGISCPSVNADGSEIPPLFQELVLLSGLAYRVEELEGRDLSKLTARLQVAANRITEVDVRDRAELYQHRVLCRNDIHKLEMEVKRQSELLTKMKPLLDLSDDWDEHHTPEVYRALKSAKCGTEEERAALRKKAARAKQRLNRAKRDLASRRVENQALKDIERTIESAWTQLERRLVNNYLSRDDALDEVLHIAEDFGITKEELEAAAQNPLNQYDAALAEIRKKRNEGLQVLYYFQNQAWEQRRELLSAMYGAARTRRLALVLLAILVIYLAKKDLMVTDAYINELRDAAWAVRQRTDAMEKELLGAKRRLEAETMADQAEDAEEAFQKFELKVQEIRGRLDRPLNPVIEVSRLDLPPRRDEPER